MKVLIISDSHGNLANLKHVLGFAKNIKMGAVIHAGDWNNAESVEIVLSFGIPLYTVLGNADIDPKIKEKLKSKSEEFGEDFLKVELGKRKIGITHKPSDIKKYFTENSVDVVFCGHLHSKDEHIINGVRVVRPGALENTVNFAIFDTISNNIEFIND